MTGHVAIAVLASLLALPPEVCATGVPVTSAGPAFASPTTLDRSGRIVIPVTVNGRGPFRFLVDTGANRSTITTELAEHLGIAYESAPQLLMNGVTGSVAVPYVEIDHLRAGDLSFQAAQVPVLLSDHVGDVDGILGMAGLRDKRLVVDFSRDHVTISRSRLDRSLTLSIKADHVAGGLLGTRARVGGVRVLAVLDTGAERTMGNRALQVALRERADGNAIVIGTTGIAISGEYADVRRLVMDRIIVSDLRITFGDFPIFDVWGLDDKPVLIVGMDVLGTLSELSMDFRTAEVRFRR